MRTRLAILLWATDPAAPHLCVTPFFHAAAAAAMDVEVEVHFSSRSVLLLVGDVAEKLYGGVGRETSVYQHMRNACDFGAKVFACSDALDAHVVDRSKLIRETQGIVGAAAFLGRVLNPDWSTLIF